MKDRLTFKPRRPKPIASIAIHRLAELFRSESEFIRQYKERTAMPELTAEQELALIKRAAEEGKAIYIGADSKGDNKPFVISGLWEFFSTYREALTRLASLYPPAPTAPAWQDDEGWQRWMKDCKGWMDCGDCEMVAGLRKCKIAGSTGDSKGNISPFGGVNVWHPPINPATGEPYLTLAAWQADQPKPMRDMTEFEITYMIGNCHRSGGSYNCACAIAKRYNQECNTCFMRDKNGHDPTWDAVRRANDSKWQAPQVPLDFTVEG